MASHRFIDMTFYNISLSEDFPSIFEIRITNEEQDLDPVFRMEKSTFQDVAGLDQLGGNPLKIFWKNNLTSCVPLKKIVIKK